MTTFTLPSAGQRSAAAPRAAGLLIEHVSKSFLLDGQPLPVLADLSLRIEPGEFVAIVGGSGCGKSTLLRLLAGLDADYQGRLLHDGAPIRGTSLRRGIVFQDHRLFPWLTVEQNVSLAFTNTTVPPGERRARVAAELARVGLEAFGAAFPHQLSGGMAQRAAIARAGRTARRAAAGRTAGRPRRADPPAPAAGIAPPVAGGGHHDADGDP